MTKGLLRPQSSRALHKGGSAILASLPLGCGCGVGNEPGQSGPPSQPQPRPCTKPCTRSGSTEYGRTGLARTGPESSCVGLYCACYCGFSLLLLRAVHRCGNWNWNYPGGWDVGCKIQNPEYRVWVTDVVTVGCGLISPKEGPGRPGWAVGHMLIKPHAAPATSNRQPATETGTETSHHPEVRASIFHAGGYRD